MAITATSAVTGGPESAATETRSPSVVTAESGSVANGGSPAHDGLGQLVEEPRGVEKPLPVDADARHDAVRELRTQGLEFGALELLERHRHADALNERYLAQEALGRAGVLEARADRELGGRTMNTLAPKCHRRAGSRRGEAGTPRAPEKLRELGLNSPVVSDKDFDLSGKLGMYGTPSAVLVDENGRFASEVAIGAANIWALVGRN